MKEIKRATDIIKANLREARDYIEEAYRLRDVSRSTADWCKEMAVGHMAFNTKGHAIVEQLIKTAPTADKSELVPGMLAVYSLIHADLAAEAAEVRAMIDTYK